MKIIYKIINVVNGKIYIGQSNGKSKSYMGGGSIMRLAFKKHGRKNFKKEIIIQGNFNQILLDELETHYIQLYNSRNKKIGYNIEPGGKSSSEKYSQSSKDKISKKLKGRKFSEESKLKMSESSKGIRHSEETKKKLSLQRKGKGLHPNMILASKQSRIKRSKKVLKFINDILICEYDSVLETAKQNNINSKSISRGLNNKRGYFKVNNTIYKFK